MYTWHTENCISKVLRCCALHTQLKFQIECMLLQSWGSVLSARSRNHTTNSSWQWVFLHLPWLIIQCERCNATKKEAGLNRSTSPLGSGTKEDRERTLLRSATRGRECLRWQRHSSPGGMVTRHFIPSISSNNEPIRKIISVECFLDGALQLSIQLPCLLEGSGTNLWPWDPLLHILLVVIVLWKDK